VLVGVVGGVYGGVVVGVAVALKESCPRESPAGCCVECTLAYISPPFISFTSVEMDVMPEQLLVMSEFQIVPVACIVELVVVALEVPYPATESGAATGPLVPDDAQCK